MRVRVIEAAGVAALALLLATGCSDSTSSADGAPRDGQGSEAAARDGTTSEGAPQDGKPGEGTPGDGPKADGPGPSTLKCSGNAPFGATFRRSCGNASDCVVARHTTDCCGNSITLGINKADRAVYDAAEKICQATWPACGCPSGPTKTDDGSTVLGAAKVAVACDNGRCTTYVEGCGKPCGSGQHCYGCVSGPSTTFACSNSCNDKGDCTDASKPECAAGIGGDKFCSAQTTCNAP